MSDATENMPQKIEMAKYDIFWEDILFVNKSSARYIKHTYEVVKEQIQ